MKKYFIYNHKRYRVLCEAKTKPEINKIVREIDEYVDEFSKHHLVRFDAHDNKWYVGVNLDIDLIKTGEIKCYQNIQ